MGEATPQPLGTGGTRTHTNPPSAEATRLPPRIRKATAARSHQGLLWPRPRVQTRLAPPQGAVATLKGLGTGVSGSLGCRHGLGQAKTSIVEPTRSSRGRAPHATGTSRTRAHSFRSTPRGRCHIEGTWSWGLVERLPLAKAWRGQAAESHAGQPFAPQRLGAHARITRATTSLHHQSMKPIAGGRSRKGSVAWIYPPSMARGTCTSQDWTHAKPPEGVGGPRAIPP